MKKKVLLAALLMAFLAVALWWIGFRDVSQPSIAVSADPTDGSPAELSIGIPDAAPAEEKVLNEETPAGPPAKRIVEVPPNQTPNLVAAGKYDDIKDLKIEEYKAFTEYNLELALAGDLGAATRVLQAKRRCENGPKTMEQVEQQLARQVYYRKRAAEEGRYPQSNRTEEDMRTDMVNWYRGCQFHDRLFTESLREKLDRLAQSGHANARYLYALWKPEFFGLTDAFVLQQQWIDKATNYSLANLTEGEIAGLLAFGQSYWQGRAFTRQDWNMSHAFILAAELCGFTNSYLSSTVERFLNSEPRDEFEDDPRPGVLNMAEGLKTFCQ